MNIECGHLLDSMYAFETAFYLNKPLNELA